MSKSINHLKKADEGYDGTKLFGIPMMTSSC